MKNTDKMIEVKNVSMRFNMTGDKINSRIEYFVQLVSGKIKRNEFWALSDVSFDVHKGEVVGIIGHNGAGKSTILKVISGILNPTKGEVQVHGNIVPMLELGSGFDYDLTGRENVFLNGAILGMSKEQIEAAFDDIVAFSEIEKFIDTETDDTINGLCDDFAEECPGIDETNFKQRISERFKQISHNAAAPKRRTKKKELTLRSDGIISPSIKEKYGALLVAEERSVCPNDGCCTPLFVNVGGKLGPNYEVTYIDSSMSEESMENMIALCPSCYSRYMAGRTAAQIQRLKQIKKDLVDDYEAKEVGASQRIEDGIRRVLEKIPKISPPEDVDLNYDPVELRQKISKDNLMLYLKVKTNVNMYNSAVEEVFFELNEERILRFRPFCTQVKLMYLNFADKDWPQGKIFEKMVDWLQNATNEDRNSCEVIISYFIRKCEVFDAITE